MDFSFDYRESDSPFVEMVWYTRSNRRPESFISTADSHWEMVITKQYGKTMFTVLGPQTVASQVPIPTDAEIFGINFKLGTFMPHLPTKKLADNPLELPLSSDRRVWFKGASWELPDFETVDTFIHRLMREELLVHDPLVDLVLQNQPPDLSLRTVQRRFLKAVGMTQGTLYQIERARQAQTLLQQGVPIADVVFQAGYADQPHLTRSLKRFIGHTPARVVSSPALIEV